MLCCRLLDINPGVFRGARRPGETLIEQRDHAGAARLVQAPAFSPSPSDAQGPHQPVANCLLNLGTAGMTLFACLRAAQRRGARNITARRLCATAASGSLPARAQAERRQVLQRRPEKGPSGLCWSARNSAAINWRSSLRDGRGRFMLRRWMASGESVSVRLVHFARLKGMHCTTGVPFGSTPLKSTSCQRAGKLIRLSTYVSVSTRPVIDVNGRSVRFNGCVNSSEQPGGVSIVQKLLNLMMKRSSSKNGVPATCAPS